MRIGRSDSAIYALVTIFAYNELRFDIYDIH